MSLVSKMRSRNRREVRRVEELPGPGAANHTTPAGLHQEGFFFSFVYRFYRMRKIHSPFNNQKASEFVTTVVS